MNNKVLIIILISILILGIICIVLLKKKTPSTEENTVIENDFAQEQKNTETTSKTLVLYFSATGNTKKIAENIRSIVDGDIIEIVPKEKYTDADLSYNNDNCRANKEQNNQNSRPEIQNKIDIECYDTIFLGYPIWWGDVPKIILTLLDNCNVSGKTIIPFCTSGSTGISQSMNTLKTYNDINWIEGKRFSSNASKKDIEEWINGLEIQKNEESKMYIKINNKILTATLENNSSVEALLEKLNQNDITINMSDYSNFEKVGDLGFSLPRNDKQISTDFGDLILYQGNSFVIYYDKNNWNFTKLGHIDGIGQEELKEILGDGDVTVTISLSK